MPRTATNYTSLIDDREFAYPGHGEFGVRAFTTPSRNANHARGYWTDSIVLDTFDQDQQYTREFVTQLTNGGPDEITPRYFAHLPVGRIAFEGIIEVGLYLSGLRSDARVDFALRTCAVDDEAVPSWDTGQFTQVEAPDTGVGANLQEMLQDLMRRQTPSSIWQGGVTASGDGVPSGHWRGLRVQVSSAPNPTMTAEREVFLCAIAQSTGPRVRAVQLYSFQVWPSRLAAEDM